MYKSMKLNFICNFIIVKYLIILSFIPAYIISQNNFPGLFYDATLCSALNRFSL